MGGDGRQSESPLVGILGVCRDRDPKHIKRLSALARASHCQTRKEIESAMCALASDQAKWKLAQLILGRYTNGTPRGL